MFKYVIIQANGKVEEREVPKILPIEELQHILDGDIERMHVLWQGKMCNAFFDEEGKPKDLPLNLKATAVFHNLYRKRVKAPGSEYADLNASTDGYIDGRFDYIRGTMVISPHSAVEDDEFEPPEPEPEKRPSSDAEIKEIVDPSKNLFDGMKAR